MPRTSSYFPPGTDADSFRRTFGENLRKAMLAKDWDQATLTRKSGLKRDAISTYVNGKTLPTPGNLVKIAKALGIPKEDILPKVDENVKSRKGTGKGVEIEMVGGERIHITIDRELSLKQAQDILAILGD